MENKLERKKRERRPRGKKEIIGMELLGLVACVFGFLAILVPALMDSQTVLPFMLLFFGLEIAAVLIFWSVLPDAIGVDVDDKFRKYGAVALSTLEGVGKMEVLATFQKRRFQERNGLYRKKCFSLAKDWVCCYLAVVDGVSVKTACESAVKRVMAANERTRCICTIVFIYQPDPTEKERQNLRELASLLLVDETVIPQSEYATILPVLVDSTTGRGAYLAKNTGISVYSFGCRLLKKYFS